MPSLRTETIRCIMCNKHLDLLIRNNEEKILCSICQANFCSACMEEIKDYRLCPAAGLLGAREHELKIIKILPLNVSPPPIVNEPSKSNKVKILPRKKIVNKGENE